MEHIVTAILASISPAAIPIVVCVLGLAYLYLKIQSQRKVTKEERDFQKDELDKRLTLVEHEIEFMKAQNQLFSSKLDRILDEITSIKVDLAKRKST